MRTMKRLAASAAVGTLAAAMAGGAYAQSTASQQQEVVVTGARTARSFGGAITQVQQAGDISIVNQQLFQRETPTQNFAQLINLLPGITYSSEDPTGLYSGDLRIHGFTGNQIGISIDGSPVNDTGNYAVYPGEYLPSELTDRIRVNLGGQEVDTPSPSSLGASIDISTKLPDATPSATVKVSAGDFSTYRTWAEYDTGAIGPTGLRAYGAFEYTTADKFRGSGDAERIGGHIRLYQPLKGTDFVSLSADWISERLYFYYDASYTQVAQINNGHPDYRYIDYNTIYVTPTVTPGKADLIPNAPASAGVGGINGSNSNYWLLHPNPVDFGTIRGTSKFTLLPNLTLTVDPSFFYTLANGGGTTNLSETDKRLIGNSNVRGVDLNGDGDTLDTVLEYQPSNTNTRRWILLTSLIYDLTPQNEFTLTYTGDYGMHRQTGEASYIYGGSPLDVFGGKDGYAPRIATADGSFIRSRDRYSDATLNQASANYIGKFFDDKLHINLGVRAPFFQRDLNQYCFTYNGTNAYCDTINTAAVQTAYNTDLAARRAPGASATALSSLLGVSVATGQSFAPNFRLPFSDTFKFNKVLPNVGATYRLGDANLFYVSYNEGFAAPRTDNLYTSSPDLVQPETSDNFAGGYRFQTRTVTASLNGFGNIYHNRIVSTPDPNDPTLTIDRNVGEVDIYGADLEAGWRPTSALSVYGSMTYQHSELQSDLVVGATGGGTTTLATAGKQLVLTPEFQGAGRVQYAVGPITLGFQGKYLSSRYVSDVNDNRIPGFATFDADLRYDLPFFNRNTYVQINIQNMFDRLYISRATTVNNVFNTTLANGATKTGSSYFDYIGAPRTFLVTLQTKF